jgi:hypothetical protein
VLVLRLAASAMAAHLFEAPWARDGVERAMPACPWGHFIETDVLATFGIDHAWSDAADLVYVRSVTMRSPGCCDPDLAHGGSARSVHSQ